MCRAGMGSKAKYQVLACLLIALGAITVGCGGSESGGANQVTWYVFNEPGGGYDAAVAKCNEQAKGRYKIKYVKLPTDSDQQRELIVRRLAAKDKDIDVMGMDVNWTAEFAQAGWILPWEGQNQQAAEGGVTPALLAGARFEDKTWVAPFTTNTQILWYRKDLVKGAPPETWDEVIDKAKEIGPKQGKIVVQGRRYEGMVVWFNSLVASAGGEIVDRDANVKLGPPAVDGARIMKRVATEAGTSTIGNDKEDTGNAVFQAENLAFMVNYPFVYSAFKENPELLKNIGWAPYPAMKKGEPAKVTFGGINLGISKYSKNPERAFEAAKCLKQDDNQIVASELGNLAPTQQKLYDDPRYKKAFPFADVIEQSLNNGVARPVLPSYADISLAIQDSLHPPGDIDPEEAIDSMREKLEKAKEGKLF